MTDAEMLSVYRGFLPFLGKVCGPGCEVVLHDLRDAEHSISDAENGPSGGDIGDSPAGRAQDVIDSETRADEDFKFNYAGKGSGKDFLSSAYCVKNEGRLIGLLCVNKDMTAVSECGFALRAMLEQFNLLGPQGGAVSENLQSPAASPVDERIAEAIARGGVLPQHMSVRDKIACVRRMEEAGVLQMKGAAAEIARQLRVSVPTAYRYISKAGASSQAG